jgi:hypothetical protein
VRSSPTDLLDALRARAESGELDPEPAVWVELRLSMKPNRLTQPRTGPS